jgi:uncharacterized protein (DUF58 family)
MAEGDVAAAEGDAGAEPRFDDVFLRKLERLAVVAKRVAARQMRGERPTRRVGTGIEFADHRDYVPGDDLRHLDWNLYGRLERPLVRMFDEDEDLPVYLLVDTSASMGLGTPPKLRLARETAAALAYVALSNLDRVALYPAAQGLGNGSGLVRGKAQIHPLLTLLSSFRPEGRTDLRAAASAVVERHRRRGVTVVISDFYDPAGYQEALDRLRYGRFEPVVVQITSPDEAAPALRGELTLVDVETGEERVVTVTPAVAEAYRQRYGARLRALDRFCRERAISCFQVGSDHPLEDLVLQVFRSGGILN